MKTIHFSLNKNLLKKCQKIILPPEDSIKIQIEKMKDHLIMESQNLNLKILGLSSNQLDYENQVFIIAKNNKNKEYSEFINPEIIENSASKNCKWEFCLSSPEYIYLIERPEIITARYYKISGEQRTEILDIYTSRIFQHENDHLEGVEFYKANKVLEKVNFEDLLQDKNKFINFYEKEIKRSHFL